MCVRTGRFRRRAPGTALDFRLKFLAQGIDASAEGAVANQGRTQLTPLLADRVLAQGAEGSRYRPLPHAAHRARQFK